MSMEHGAWSMEPERRFERAQEAQRGVIARLRALLESDAAMTMGADALEIMALQFQLACANLRTAARELRECEEERRMLARVRECEERRFETLNIEHETLNIEEGRAVV